MKTVKSITSAFPHFNPTLASTLEGESGYGLQLTEALNTLKQTHSQKLLDLLPDSIADIMKEDYTWPHDAIQRELDNIVSEKIEDQPKKSKIDNFTTNKYGTMYAVGQQIKYYKPLFYVYR